MFSHSMAFDGGRGDGATSYLDKLGGGVDGGTVRI